MVDFVFVNIYLAIAWWIFFLQKNSRTSRCTIRLEQLLKGYPTPVADDRSLQTSLSELFDADHLQFFFGGKPPWKAIKNWKNWKMVEKLSYVSICICES